MGVAMQPTDLLLRCLAFKEDGQWVVMCLNFDLAAQADTLDKAKSSLEVMIAEYVYDALVGEDREYAAQLLKRRAPARYWVEYYSLRLWQHIRHIMKRRMGFELPMPMAPAHAHSA